VTDFYDIVILLCTYQKEYIIRAIVTLCYIYNAAEVYIVICYTDADMHNKATTYLPACMDANLVLSVSSTLSYHQMSSQYGEDLTPRPGE